MREGWEHGARVPSRFSATPKGLGMLEGREERTLARVGLVKTDLIIDCADEGEPGIRSLPTILNCYTTRSDGMGEITLGTMPHCGLERLPQRELLKIQGSVPNSTSNGGRGNQLSPYFELPPMARITIDSGKESTCGFLIIYPIPRDN